VCVRVCVFMCVCVCVYVRGHTCACAGLNVYECERVVLCASLSAFVHV